MPKDFCVTARGRHFLLAGMITLSKKIREEKERKNVKMSRLRSVRDILLTKGITVMWLSYYHIHHWHLSISVIVFQQSGFRFCISEVPEMVENLPGLKTNVFIPHIYIYIFLWWSLIILYIYIYFFDLPRDVYRWYPSMNVILHSNSM